MKRKLALFLGVILIISLFAACGQKTSQNNSTAKELDAAMVQAPNTFYPFGSHSMSDEYGYSQVFDTLITKDNNGNIVPSLAKKYDISSDGKVFTFTLTKGVKFTNGTEFKASDAKFSLEKAKQAPYSASLFADVTSIDAVDDYTVKITLKNANASFMKILSTNYCPMVSKEALTKYGDKFGLTPEATVGTGPYILKELQPAQLCVFEANPDYFKGAANVKKIRIKTIGDSNAAMIALQTGEIQYYFNDIPGMSKDTIGKNEKLTLETFNSLKFYTILLNNSKGPFADVRLRQAIAYAIDRKKSLAVGLDGDGTIVDTPGGQDFTANPGGNWSYKLDIEKAKQLVKDAGMEGKTITIKTLSSANFPKIATALQDDLSKIGLTVKVSQEEQNTMITEASKGDFDMVIISWNYTTKDMGEAMSNFCLSPKLGAQGNMGGYSNPAMDQLLQKAQREMDNNARKQLYADALKIFNNDVPLIPLYYPNSSRAYSNNLVINKGYVQYNLLYYFKWNISSK